MKPDCVTVAVQSQRGESGCISLSFGFGTSSPIIARHCCCRCLHVTTDVSAKTCNLLAACRQPPNQFQAHVQPESLPTGPKRLPFLGTPHARWLQAVVGEFCLASASELGLSWELHERCRSTFEELYLQSLFLHAQRLARGAAAATPLDAGQCGACVSLVHALMAWDFRYSPCAPLCSGGRGGCCVLLVHALMRSFMYWPP